MEDMDNTSGERQEYWLLAIQAAREERILRYREINKLANEMTAQQYGKKAYLRLLSRFHDYQQSLISQFKPRRRKTSLTRF